jgi:hypothetical protein
MATMICTDVPLYKTDLNEGYDECIKREVCLRMQKEFRCFAPFFPMTFEDGMNIRYQVNYKIQFY